MVQSLRRFGGDLFYLARVVRRFGGVHPRQCPCCGYHGRFKAYGEPPRFDARCPSCRSLERHRLLVLLDTQRGLLRHDGATLHFAPEAPVEEYLRRVSRSYLSADIASPRADCRENIEDLSFADSSFDQIVCAHVLEHVDDRRALAELFRVLKPGGVLVAMVPIVEGWASTYEDASVVDPLEREVHFGQHDHVRFYGRDFRDRVRAAGFSLRELAADGDDVVRYGLARGETVFLCERPAEALAAPAG